MASAATLTLALVALLRYLARPGILSAAWLGGAIALTLVTKLSAVLFLPVAAIAIIILAMLTSDSEGRPLRTVRPIHLVLVGGAAFVVMWATYRFSMGTLLDVDQGLAERLPHALGARSQLASMLIRAAHWRASRESNGSPALKTSLTTTPKAGRATCWAPSIRVEARGISRSACWSDSTSPAFPGNDGHRDRIRLGPTVTPSDSPGTVAREGLRPIQG